MPNYRPVSLLTSFSKIFEMVMQRRILKHLTNYNILSTEQYGFRLGLRTDNATCKLTTEILNAMNNELLIGGIFFFDVLTSNVSFIRVPSSEKVDVTALRVSDQSQHSNQGQPL